MANVGIEIEFDAHFGDEMKHVSISQYWGDTYHVIVNLRHWGEVSKVNGEWVGVISKFGEMYYGDIAVIGEVIDSTVGAD